MQGYLDRMSVDMLPDHDSTTAQYEKIEEIILIFGLLLESVETDGGDISHQIIDTIPIILNSIIMTINYPGDNNIFNLYALNKRFIKSCDVLMNVQDALQYLSYILQNITITSVDKKDMHDGLTLQIKNVDILMTQQVESMKDTIIESFKLAVWSINDDVLRQVRKSIIR
jgi:hypothetical protein